MENQNIEQKELKKIVEKQVEVPEGRQEAFFFPDKMITITASSYEEALKKYNEIKFEATLLEEN